MRSLERRREAKWNGCFVCAGVGAGDDGLLGPKGRKLRIARKDGILDGVDGIDGDAEEGRALLSDVRRMSGKGLILLDIDDRDVRGVIIAKPGDRSAIVSTKMKRWRTLNSSHLRTWLMNVVSMNVELVASWACTLRRSA